jgi:3-oxoacyl-(acyl-carrier-protein) synthase
MNSDSLRNARIEIVAAASVLPAPQPVMQPALRATDGGECAAYACPDSVGADVIAPAELRRIGRSQRMALAAVRRATAQCPGGAVDEHAAICVGTALGTLAETAAFLENMVERDESEPRPARFINSVHNAIASRIAISLGCTGENHTFTHQAVSFELALWHAMHLLRSGRAGQAIVCAADEWSPYVNAVGRARGWWRNAAQPLAPMSGAPHDGTLPGEGAAALILRSAQAGSSGTPAVSALRFEPLTMREIARPDPDREVGFIRKTLARAEADLSTVDMILVGANGDARSDAAYAGVVKSLSDALGRSVPCRTFKQMCGEFCTASAIGCAMASDIVRERVGPRGVLLYNRHETGYHSACLVTA